MNETLKAIDAEFDKAFVFEITFVFVFGLVFVLVLVLLLVEDFFASTSDLRLA